MAVVAYAYVSHIVYRCRYMCTCHGQHPCPCLVDREHGAKRRQAAVSRDNPVQHVRCRHQEGLARVTTHDEYMYICHTYDGTWSQITVASF